MKKIIFVFALFAVISCKKEEVKPVNYTLFTGQITNQNNDILTVYKGRDVVVKIKLDANGKFADTLRLDEGQYVIYDGTEHASIYIAKGKHFNLTLDAKKFDETLTFTGLGAEANLYFAKQTLLQEEVLNFEELMSGDQTNLDATLKSYRTQYLDLLKNAKGLDSLTIAGQTHQIEGLATQITSMYIEKQKINAMIGKPSAPFNFENHKGGKTTLASLKGKFVYIDVWATWCGPCKKEIPFLQKLEEEYHGKNIEFVSISVDQVKDHEKWKNFVTDKKLGGIQLFADKDWKSDFVIAYQIKGIPRFILIDPKGNIVNPDAPRPSSDKIREAFTKQGI